MRHLRRRTNHIHLHPLGNLLVLEDGVIVGLEFVLIGIQRLLYKRLKDVSDGPPGVRFYKSSAKFLVNLVAALLCLLPPSVMTSYTTLS